MRSSSPRRSAFITISSGLVIATPVRGGSEVSGTADENSFLLQMEGVLRSSVVYFSGFQEKQQPYFIDENSYSFSCLRGTRCLAGPRSGGG